VQFWTRTIGIYASYKVRNLSAPSLLIPQRRKKFQSL
jgi:hypothetical protein